LGPRGIRPKLGGYRNLESYKVLFDFFDKHSREPASP
jgi:hypothetical protein